MFARFRCDDHHRVRCQLTLILIMQLPRLECDTTCEEAASEAVPGISDANNNKVVNDVDFVPLA